MANESELRFLTVERTGSPTTDGIAVSAKSGESRIVHARLVSGEALFESCGVFVDDGATVYARDSSIEGAVEGVQVATGGTAVLAYSELINGYANSGTLSCVFSHDDTLKELDASCDPLP
jgi:hypothetical protein